MSLENDHKKVQNLKHLSFSVFFFTLAYERIFIKTRSVESRCVIGPENILLQARPCIFQPGNFTDWGSEEVNHLQTSVCHFKIRVHIQT